MKSLIFLFGIFVILKIASSQDSNDVEESSTGWHQIEGKVYAPDQGASENWQEETQIVINGGTSQFLI